MSQTSTDDVPHLDELDPGEAPVVTPIDGVTVTAHGLSDASASELLFTASVYDTRETDDEPPRLVGIYQYTVVDIESNGGGAETIVLEPDRHTHDLAEDALAEMGGRVR